MKRRDLIRHIEKMGCILIRHGGGGKHDWYQNPKTKTSQPGMIWMGSIWMVYMDGVVYGWGRTLISDYIIDNKRQFLQSCLP